MKLVYEIKEGRAVVWRCYDYGSEAGIPETIEECPVTELAPYAFSAHMEERLLERGIREGRLRLWDSDGGFPYDSACFSDSAKADADTGALISFEDVELPPALTGAVLTAVSLPSPLRKIGAYAFYNCSRLQTISFYGGLIDLGAGLFTGCHAIKELVLRLDGTGVSCLREILIEVPEKLTVSLEGSVNAKLIFPEFFEESVENTPARILVIHTHGSGMNFRNCFYDRKFDFRAYDACFYHAKAEEDFDTVLEMTMARLMYPAGLLPENRAAYEAWLQAHAGQAVEKAVSGRDMEALEYLAEYFLKKKKTGDAMQGQPEDILEHAVSLAAERGFPEGVSFLMDMLYRCRAERDGDTKGLKSAGMASETGCTEAKAKRFEL